MSLQDRFQFPAPLPNRPADGPDLALHGLESATGREATLHLLSAAALDNARILKQIDELNPLDRAHILDTGVWNGAPYVVTDPLPGGQGLRRWVNSLADDSLDKLGRAGTFRIPLAAPAQPPAAPRLPLGEDAPTELLPASPAAAGPSEFTALFQGGHVDAKPAPEPGEFTRMFQGKMPGRAPEPSPAAAPEPGEFTRMFQGQMPAGPPAPPSPPAPREPETGDFTRFFERPPGLRAGSPPTPEVPTPPPPGPADPSEFTQMLRGFAAPTAPQPYTPPAPSPGLPAPKGEAGEFTRMVQAPLPDLKPTQPIAPSPQGNNYEPGEFTRMLEAQVDAPLPAAKPRMPAGGDATRAFPFDEVAAGETPQPAGPSEYTLLFKQPKAAPVNEEAAGTKPAPPPPRKKETSLWPLVLILITVLLLLAGIAAGLIYRS